MSVSKVYFTDLRAKNGDNLLKQAAAPHKNCGNWKY